MNSLFSDCFSILILPDISKWNNYNENHINLIPDYNKINDIINLDCFYINESSEDYKKMLNDPIFLGKKSIEKMKRLNLI